MFRRLFSTFGLLVVALSGGLMLAVALSVDEAEPRGRLLGLVAAGGGLGLVLVAGLSAVLARQVARPLNDLIAAVEKTAAGASGQRVFPAEGYELSRLGRTFNDMSDRLAGRIAQLEEDRQQLRTVLSGMVEGVVALDAEQRVRFANDRAGQLLELPVPSPVGRPLWEVVRHRPLLDLVRRALGGPEPQREEFAWNGTAVRSLTVHAARLPGPPPRGAVLVVHDTSDIRRLERLRQEFVANVSHELKTPLSVIKVCVETLLDGAVDDARHRGRFLEQIAEQSDRLHALILDLLSLAQIESGDELFEFDEVPLDAVVRAALERHRARAEARQQTLTADGEVPPVAAWADEDAVDQILENLLDNALKYTPEGGQIRARWYAAAGQACFEVADTGIGIPEADLPRIFERFYRVDKARSRELGGTGLGLSIVKHLAQALRGSVRASSRLGEGTTFTVSLPLAPAGGGRKPPARLSQGG